MASFSDICTAITLKAPFDYYCKCCACRHDFALFNYFSWHLYLDSQAFNSLLLCMFVTTVEYFLIWLQDTE